MYIVFTSQFYSVVNWFPVGASSFPNVLWFVITSLFLLLLSFNLLIWCKLRWFCFYFGALKLPGMCLTPISDISWALQAPNFLELMQSTFLIKCRPTTPIAHISIQVHAIIRIGCISLTPFTDLRRAFNSLHFRDFIKFTLTVKRRPATAIVIIPVAILSILF